MRNCRPAPWQAWLLLVPLAAALGDGRLLAIPDDCAVCGAPITNRVYSVEDQLTGERTQFCADCAKLRTICFFCGVPVKTNYTELPDGRILCARDARSAVLDEAEAKRVCRETKLSLDRLFSRSIAFPDTNVTVGIVDRVHLHELFKFAGNDYACPNVWGYMQTTTNRGHVRHKISFLSALPLACFQATVAHEYTHTWLNENLPQKRKRSLNRDTEEGFCELVSYLLMDSEGEEAQEGVIKRNAYTRGQIHLFIDAEQTYGLNAVLDWMKYGLDDRLNSDEPLRIRALEKSSPPTVAATTAPTPGSPGTTVPDTLVLRGIYWTQPRPMALINNRTLALNEQGRVRVGTTNVVVRCLSITKDSVRIRMVGSGEEQELRFKTPPP